MNGPMEGWVGNENEPISEGLNPSPSPVCGRAYGEATSGCFLREEIVEMPLRVVGGTKPAGSHTGFPSHCGDVAASGGRHRNDDFTV